MTFNSPKYIGVIGGMGPEASLLFYQKVTAQTAASKDQDHVDLIILNHASMPDRTNKILAGQTQELVELLSADVKIFQAAGAQAFVMTCNTSEHTEGKSNKSAVGGATHNLGKYLGYFQRRPFCSNQDQ